MDTVDAFPYADSAVTYDFEGQEEHQPIYDRETEDKYVRAKVLEHLGEEDKKAIHPIMWIIFIMVLIQILITLFGMWNSGARI
jgi:hypothetical protein